MKKWYVRIAVIFTILRVETPGKRFLLLVRNIFISIFFVLFNKLQGEAIKQHVKKKERASFVMRIICTPFNNFNCSKVVGIYLIKTK